jgi:hypothetical protein
MFLSRSLIVLLGSVVFGSAVPIDGIPETPPLTGLPTNSPAVPQQKPDPHTFMTQPRPGTQRYFVTLPVGSGGSDSVEEQLAQVELATIHFISPTAAGAGASAMPLRKDFEGWDRNFGSPQIEFEEDLPFLRLVGSLQGSPAWIALDQLADSYRGYGDAIGVDVMQRRSGITGDDASVRGTEDASSPGTLTAMRIAVPVEQDDQNLSARIVYVLSYLADPYRILVKHPIAVFIGSCMLALLLSLRRRH